MLRGWRLLRCRHPCPRPDALCPPCSNWLLPVLRLLVVLPSSARSVRVGSALMLERPPRPGWRGAWNDAVTMLPGAVGACAYAGEKEFV